MATARTSYLGTKLRDDVSAGFSLFGALCLICGLSFVGLGMLSALTLRHSCIRRESARFYADLAQSNAAAEQELHAAGFFGADHAAD